MNEIRPKQCKASVTLIGDESVFLITETPSEAAEIVDDALRADETFAQLTSGNTGDWNGKPFYVRADRVHFIMPPLAQ